jgi:hypothetical protein
VDRNHNLKLNVQKVKNLKKFLLAFVLMIAVPLSAQITALSGYCLLGATQARTSGLYSSNYMQGLIPGCTVTVYLTGTTTLATIYADGAGTPLTNPFTANLDASWLLYATINQGYDIVLSGGIIPNVYLTPVTLVSVFPNSLGEAFTFPGAVPNECVGTDVNGNFTSTGSPCGTGGGGGGVTFVGLTMPPIFSVSGSPITTAGTFAVTLVSELANLSFASPDGQPGIPSFRRLTEADFPFTYSGSTAELATVSGNVPTNVVAAWDNAGNLIAANSSSTFPGIVTGTIAASQVTGLAPSATIDTTNANNITSGTLNTARLPASQFACPMNQFITSFTINNVSTLSCINPTSITGQVNSGILDSIPYYSSTPTGSVLSPSSATLDALGNITATTLQLTGALTLLPLASTNAGCLFTDTAGNINSTGFGCGINGTVTSVGLEMPSIFTVFNSPIISSGVITVESNDQTANTFYAGPQTITIDGEGHEITTGPPTFRHFSMNDMPTPPGKLLVLASPTTDPVPGALYYDPVYRSLTLPDLPNSTTPSLFLTSQVCGGGDICGPQYRAITALDLPSTINSDTTGNAATSSAFNHAPIQCVSGFATGITATGAANCSPAGTLTSVGLTAPSIFTVTNSPITSSGNIDLSLNSEGANTFFAAPSGGAGVPSFRAIATADLPNVIFKTTPTQCVGQFSTGIDASGNANCVSAGSVTSVGLSAPSVFVVGGSPVTSSGTLALTLASEPGNTVWAGPAAGGSSAPTFRALVANDIPATINSDTTGSAATVSGTIAIANGGTGATNAAAALTNLGAASISTNNFSGTQTAPVFNATTGYQISGGYGTSGQCLVSTGSGTSYQTCTGGSVTSVALTAPNIFSVTGSPITTTGTLALSLVAQSAKTFFAGPVSTGSAAPSFRAIDPTDLPTNITSNTSGNAATATVLAATPTFCTLNHVAYGITTSGNALCSIDSAAFLTSTQTFTGTNTFQGESDFQGLSNFSGSLVVYSSTNVLDGTFIGTTVDEYSTTIDVLKLTVPTGQEFYVTGGTTHLNNNLTVEGTTILNGPVNVGGVATMNVTNFANHVTLLAQNIATISDNFESNLLSFDSSYYDSGGIVQTPAWTINTVISSGTTPTNNLVFSFADTGSGVLSHTVVIPSVQLSGLVGCLYADASGNVFSNGQDCGTQTGGTVSSFSAGNLSPLFTTTVTNPTTTPALSFTLSNAAAHTFFGNNTAASAAPGFETINAADLPSDIAYLDVAQTFTQNVTIDSSHTLSVQSLTDGRCVEVSTDGTLVSASTACQAGTVTSVAVSVPAQLTISGSPITTSGTLALGINGTGTGTELVTAAAAGAPGHAAVWTSNGDVGDGGAPSAGTVTSVALSMPTGFSVSGSPITTSGTFTVTYTSGSTGSGAMVFATSPTLVTPVLGAATATSINGVFLRAVATGNIGISNASAIPSVTGTNNSGFGSSSLQSLTSGSNNTSIGVDALSNLTTGSLNTAIGAQAGATSTSLSNSTTADSVFVGYNTMSLNNGDTNETVIGYTAIGAGSNTAVLGNASTTDVYFGSATGVANIHASNAVLTGAASISGNNCLQVDASGNITNTGVACGSSQTRDVIHAGFVGIPSNSQSFGFFLPSSDQIITVPANFTNSRAAAQIAATATTVFDINLCTTAYSSGCTVVGTITFAASGTVGTFSTASSFAVDGTAGNGLYFSGPATADATLANIAIAIYGTHN